jgi:molybdate transport system substrate-binding protein
MNWIRSITVALAVGVAALAAGESRAVEIKVLCSNGFQAVIAELSPQFERVSGHRVAIRYGLAGVLGKEIEDGEPFDLAILAPPQIDSLIAQNRIAAESRVVLARSGIGVMVRTGAPKPDISTIEAFKSALLAAKSIAFPPRGQSGIYLVGMIDRLGLGPALQSKLMPIANGPMTGEAVARGVAEIGITPIGELLSVKGVSLVGPLPAGLQNYIVQTAGVSANAPQMSAAMDLLAFLRSPVHLPLIRAKGMEPS